ncbi:MAG: helix-turn-helix transcriptional regulator [Clostridia bacterium]|nr:helix-turn-helix transcriptional regulator [Clostridia bacterium]
MEQNTLGKRIKEARKKLKLTQEKLSEKANISNVYLGEIERGEKTPSIPVLIDLIEALDVSADYLLRDELNSASVIINNELTEKLSKLTPKQRKTAIDILNAYINNL